MKMEIQASFFHFLIFEIVDKHVLKSKIKKGEVYARLFVVVMGGAEEVDSTTV